MPEPGLRLEAYNLQPDGGSDYRFLVDNAHVIYISVEAGAFPYRSPVHFPWHPVMRRILPPLPGGVWNQGYIVKCPRTGLPVFSTTSLRGDLPGVRHIWHPVIVDHLDLAWVVRNRQQVGIVTCPQFRGRVVYKHAPFPWMVHEIEQETAVWKRISEDQGRAIHYWAPRFLGHVSEEGRIIGFLTEHIHGRPPDDEGDWEVCCEALEKLHGLGIKHGDIQKGSFVIRRGRRGDEAVLVDFGHTLLCQNALEFAQERADLSRCLRRGVAGEIRAYEVSSGQDE